MPVGVGVLANAEGQLPFSFLPDRIRQQAGSYKTAFFDQALEEQYPFTPNQLV
ncbi:hypothetical protein [Pseudomonas sp. S2_H01]|jgi:hypothetical protein